MGCRPLPGRFPAFRRQVLDCAKQAMLGVGRIGTTDMAHDSDKGDKKDARQDRLKLALRENLKRRKAQARERGKNAEASSDSHETSLHGEVGKRRD